jgi:hypothetical protein
MTLSFPRIAVAAGKCFPLRLRREGVESWRLRRVLMAESSEVQKNVESYEWQQRNSQDEECSRIDDDKLISVPGLINQVQNPAVLQRCVEMLEELKKNIESRGFEEETDNLILDAIYGERDERLSRHPRLKGASCCKGRNCETNSDNRIVIRYLLLFGTPRHPLGAASTGRGAGEFRAGVGLPRLCRGY